MKIQGPVEVEVKVGITDGDICGEVTIGLGRGKYPTEEEIRKAVARLESEKDSLPPGFRLMTKREWWDRLCETEVGDHFALPGGNDYEA